MSAVKGHKRIDVLRASQTRRQEILDHLAATPLLTSKTISSLIGCDIKTTSHTLSMMRKRREVATTGAHHSTRYVALATTTVSAEVLDAAMAEQRVLKAATRRVAEVAVAVKKNHAEPWRTVHRGGGDPAIKRQGGQGSQRRTVFVNCTQNY